jgi:hypothetical protein
MKDGMTVRELKDILGRLNVPDDHVLRIQFYGGVGGSTVAASRVYKGFDWTKGELVVVPDGKGLVPREWYEQEKRKGGGKDARKSR